MRPMKICGYSWGWNWPGLMTWMEYHQLETTNRKMWLHHVSESTAWGKRRAMFWWEANCLSLSWGTGENSFKRRWVNASKHLNEPGRSTEKWRKNWRSDEWITELINGLIIVTHAQCQGSIPRIRCQGTSIPLQWTQKSTTLLEHRQHWTLYLVLSAEV